MSDGGDHPLVRTRIPSVHAASFRVGPGDEFAVVAPEGTQVADLAAVTPDGSRLSAAQSRDFAGTLRPTTGDRLVDERGRDLLTIRDDDCGHNDLLYAPCAGWLLEPPRFEPGEVGCRENLSLALGTPVDDTLNCFMRVDVADAGDLAVRRSPAEPGDRVAFRAEADLDVGVSACATLNRDSGINGEALGPVAVEVPPAVDDEGVEVVTAGSD